MTNAERQTHVIRILGTNKAGDVLPDIWADVERIDRMEIMTQVIQGPGGAVNQYQKITIKLRWLDDPDGQDYDPDGDRNREHKIVKVCDPSETNLDNPEEWIPIRSIVRMEVKHDGGNILKHFKESVANSDIDSRVIENRRITHWETTIDDAAQKAFDADPTRKVYVEPDGNRKYERIEGTEDKGQYVEHQITKKLNRQDSQQLLSTGNDQRRVLYLKNQYQIDESHPAKLEELGKDDINPPYRLDPFQNIININFGFSVIVVFVDPDNQFKSTLDVIDDKAEQLDQYNLTTIFANPSWVTAFKVSVGAGEFIKVTTSSSTVDGLGIGNQVGRQFGCYVFAKDGTIEDSLARAKSGTQTIVAGNWANAGGTVSTAPAGLIWSAGSNHLPPGKVTNWKIRYANHRNDKNEKNKMVQCYPISGPWTMSPIAVTYTGYWVFIYRLDKKGTGPVYGTTDLFSSDLSKVSVDPAWHQQISSAGNNDPINYGIPFGDPPPALPDKPPDLSGPPPLITRDVESFPYPDDALTRVDDSA